MTLRLICALCFGPALAWCEPPVLLFAPLPEALRLPPGLVETLPLNHTNSFFGEAMRAVDCTGGQDLPFNICGNQLFGGDVMGDTHLTGDITIQFFPPVSNVTHFVVTQHSLAGDDTELAAPLGYALRLRHPAARDAEQLSSGDLDLTTGGVTNLTWYVKLSDTALDAIGKVNPKLAAPTIEFPGTRGHVWATFTQRADGLLDFYFRGSTFLPLGKDTLGDPVRFPLPFCSADNNCASIPARGTSLHLHLYLDTAASSDPPCAPNCPDIPVNTTQEFKVHSYFSQFGDAFSLDIPQLGGAAEGRSHLQGNLVFQFGPRSGDTVPFTVRSTVPTALFATPPVNPIAGAGVYPGLLGQNELLRFPRYTYNLRQVAFVDEPYNFPQGAINLKTGRVIGDMEYPAFYAQTLADELFKENAGRISKEPFYVIADRYADPARFYALFEKSTSGETLFRFSGQHRRSFATYRFPNPNFVLQDSWIAGPEANLDLFLRLQASHAAGPSTIAKSGAGSFASSLGDSISYSFSLTCNAPGAPATFTYTNNNTGASGGTFTMHTLAAASCTNSLISAAGKGDYDSIHFSGFGTWSKDAAGATPRFATADISLNPAAPYVGVFVYQPPDAAQDVVLSSANNKPAAKTTP